MARSFIMGLAAAAVLGAAGIGRADGPEPFADFTFKRVKVPAPGAGKRITVQIVPRAPRPADEPAAAEAPRDSDPYAWFWEAVSPEMAATGPGRLAEAVRMIDGGPGVPEPRVQALQSILADYGTEILSATIGTQVSPALVLAVISAESSGRKDAISHAGAHGLMQLMPDTAERFGVQDLTDPGQNIRGGVAYLDWLMGNFGRDPILVLAGYNAGENAVTSHGGVPPYAETRAYVPRVLAAWRVARGMCLTPPELITDGCAFSLAGYAGDG